MTRVASLAYIEQSNVAPSLGVATDRHLVGALARPGRSRPGVLRVYSYPGEVLAAGRWHLAPPGVESAGEAFQRRITGGRVLALGEGYVGLSLLLPHRSALVADEPLALAPAQVPNRYVRGLMRALKGLGLAAYYPGRDLITVNRRPIAAVGFETDREGRLVFEAVLAVGRPLGAVAHLLDRWDVSGTIRADLLALEGGTSVHEEIGEIPDLGELGALLREGYAQQFDVAITDDPLSALEVQAIEALAAREGVAWNGARRRRSDLPLVGTTGVQTGVLEVHFALEQGRFLKDVMLAGDLIADSAGLETLEYRLRLCPAEPAAIAEVVASVYEDRTHFLLGVGPLRTVAETVMKGIPA